MPSKRKPRGKGPGILRLPNNWDPRWYQRDFWDYFETGGKRGVAIWHRRAGKDDVALHRTAISAHQKTATYWHLLPEYAQGRKAIWDAINPRTGKRRIDEAFPEHLRSHTDERGMFIRFTTGSTWQVIGSDNFNSIVGSPPYGIVFSEWALSNPAAWAYLSPILEENGGWAMFITTPRGKNHGYSFYHRARCTDGWFGIKQGVNDTGIFSPEQLANVKSELVDLYGEEDGENLFNQEYHCSFDAAVLGSYYGRILAELEQAGRITSVPYDPNYPVWTSWDLGLDDLTVVWFVQIVGREVRWIDYYESRNRSLIDSAREILSKRYVYREHYGPHDIDTREQTSAKTRKQTLEGVGLTPLRAGSQIGPAERIHALRNLLKISIFDAVKCAKGLEALRHYHAEWDDKAKTPKKTPKHDWSSHAADAAGEMAIQLYDSKTSLAARQRFSAADYDVLRVGEPGYINSLNREDDYGDRPWMRQETSGMDWDPLA
jgi:hypothetical protein